MKKTISLLAAVVAMMLCLTGSATPLTPSGDDDAALKRMALFAGNMLTYNNNFTQEKVYLHLDNNGYIAGEHLWFKAYVFKAASLLPTDMSKVLYVELLNPDGELMERKTLKVDNGRTYGDFDLDPMLCHQGFYELRAYTRAMLNWDPAYIYSRVIPVFDQPKDSVNYTGMAIYDYEYDQRTDQFLRRAPKPLTTQSTVKKSNILLTFYPEGGHLTKGVPNRVAYKITDEEGVPVAPQLVIHNSDGSQVTTSKVLHDGMGVFSLPAEWGGGYAELSDGNMTKAQFPLPAQRSEGSDLTATCSPERGMEITIRSSQAMTGRMLGLSVTCRGTLLYFNTVKTENENNINIPYDKLRDGVAQVTLFTDEGEVLSERLLWVEPKERTPLMTVQQNKQVYQPFEPIVLDVSLKDGEGHPLQADFSLSVRDAATETGPDPCGLRADMLLSSELKGYIHNPDYYFESDDTTHRQALDLLMMVQGWRRYKWQEMSGVEPLQVQHPCELGLTLIGNLTTTRAANKYLQREGSLDVNFLIQSLEGTKIFDMQTDSTGYFAVQMPDFNGDAPCVMTVTNNKDKRVYSDFILDRNFSPVPSSFEPLEITSSVGVMESRVKALSREAETFEWTDTIPDYVSDIVHLKEVTVKGRRTLGYRPGARFTWMGGENATKGSATRYYNLSEELDRYLDSGKGVPYVWDWLLEHDKDFDYDYENGDVWYRGKRVIFVIDNNYPGASFTATTATGDELNTGRFLMSHFQSLSIVENEAVAEKVMQFVTRSPYANTGNARVVFFLYSRSDLRQPNGYRRGTRWINLHGYSLCSDFYSPDYRRHDIPSDQDHRRTLYWNPSLVTDTNGQASVLFYAGSRPDERLHINAQGIAVNGQMVELKQ